MRRTCCAMVLFAAAAFAQPTPEECLGVAGPDSGVAEVVETASYGGREYRFKRAGCKALFETDPERYAQLYDALLQLQASGQEIKPSVASLVPS